MGFRFVFLTAVIIVLGVVLNSGCAQHFTAQSSETPLEAARQEDLDNNHPAPPAGPAPPHAAHTAPVIPAKDPKTLTDIRASGSLSLMARWVVQNEAKKVGPACNFFVQRVLQLLGFGDADWMANDFRSAAPHIFNDYDEEAFVHAKSGSELARLKKYIWSFPERTGLIFNWVIPGHGHIAIVERIQDTLIIHQASLNTYVAKTQTIKPELLLNSQFKDLHVFANLS